MKTWEKFVIGAIITVVVVGIVEPPLSEFVNHPVPIFVASNQNSFCP